MLHLSYVIHSLLLLLAASAMYSNAAPTQIPAHKECSISKAERNGPLPKWMQENKAYKKVLFEADKLNTRSFSGTARDGLDYFRVTKWPATSTFPAYIHMTSVVSDRHLLRLKTIYGKTAKGQPEEKINIYLKDNDACRSDIKDGLTFLRGGISKVEMITIGV